jgi:hypothetical protein
MDIGVVNRVIEAYGGSRKVQERFGYTTRMTVYIWRKRGLPSAKIGQIHMDTKIPIKVLMTGVRQAEAKKAPAKDVFEAMGLDSPSFPSIRKD